MLTLAIPSKGRLKDNCNAWFAERGAVMEQTAGGRGYRATLGRFARCRSHAAVGAEIAASLLAGDVHLGITGEDLLREEAPELTGRMHLIKPLGFGFADVVVAVAAPGSMSPPWPTWTMSAPPLCTPASAACVWRPNMPS